MELRLKYKKEVAEEYGFDRKTLYNKMKKFGIVIPRGQLTPCWQKLIYETLGYPPGVEEDDYEGVSLPNVEKK